MPGVFGLWSTEDGRGVIRIAPCGEAVCGTIVGISEFRPDGQPPFDWRGESQCGLAFIRVKAATGADGRLHGSVADPRNGRTYNAELWLGSDGAVRLRGYLGIELFGSTQRWPVFSGRVRPGCHFQG